MEAFGLSVRVINRLEKFGCMFVGEALGMRLEQVMEIIGHKATLELVTACENLRLNKRIKD
tara:strand:- start:3510 stop:3692 length:183 start_codon:yes stop_codon:yes gene_type:complete